MDSTKDKGWAKEVNFKDVFPDSKDVPETETWDRPDPVPNDPKIPEKKL